MAPHGARHAREKGADAENGDFLGRQVDAQALGRHVVIPHGDQAAAVGRTDDPVHDEQGHHQHRENQRGRGQVRQARNAPGAVGHGVGIIQHRPDDHDQAKGGDRQVMSLEAQDRDADEHRHERGGKSGYQQGRKQRDLNIGQPLGQSRQHRGFLRGAEGQKRGNIRPHRHKRRVAHGEHATKAVDQVQAGRQQYVDGKGAGHGGVVAAFVAGIQHDQYGQHHKHRKAEQGTIAQTCVFHQLRPLSDCPSRPLGRTRSTRINTTNTKASR